MHLVAAHIIRSFFVFVIVGFIFSNSATASVLIVNAGQPVQFSVSAQGTQPFTYQWRKNGAAISAATNATYTLATTTAADSATYTVVVTNSVDSTISDDATLTANSVIVAPIITNQPASVTVTAGQPASFSVTASGSGSFTYQWLKNGAAISGANSATYTIAATTIADNGSSYSVIVSNSGGPVTSNAAVLTINSDLGLVELSPLSFSARGQNSPVEGIAQLFDGQTSTKWLDFSAPSWVQITLAAPASLQAYGFTSANDAPERDPASWTLSGSNDGITWTVIETRTGQSWSSRFQTRDFILTTPSIAYTQFRFDLQSSSGSIVQLAELELFGLTGASLPPLPVITNQPASINVTAGQSASFSVAASGTGNFTYQWFKNAVAISGATSATYTIASTTTADAAGYSVVVTNSTGPATSNSAILTVNPAIVAPQITNQPVSLTITAGEPATFLVTASGTATLIYQWMKNGVAISGNTSNTSPTFTIAASAAADAANYSVVVTNVVGTVTSNIVTLTVNAASSLVDLTPQSYSARGQASTAQSISKLFDGQPSTKWVDNRATTWVKVVFASPTILEAYGLTSANDAPERDPASWTLSGSNDGTTWTVIETRTSQSWTSRLLPRDFILAAPTGAYTQFRFDFKATSGSITQLAELETFGRTVVSAQLTPLTYSARGQSSAPLGIAKLFDGKTSTNWADLSGTSWVNITLKAPAILRRYTLTSSSDAATRDPASWTLSGSNDGTTWTVIETRASQTWSSRRLTRDFVLATASARFTQFRFDLKATSGNVTELAELKLFGEP